MGNLWQTNENKWKIDEASMTIQWTINEESMKINENNEETMTDQWKIYEKFMHN